MAARIAILSLLLCLGQSCRPTGEDFAIKTAPEFKLGVREALGPAPRAVEMVLQTRDTLPCSQASLNYSALRTDRLYDLHVQGFHFPDPCQPAQGLFQTTFYTGWAETSSYHIQLGIGEFIRNSAVLTVNETVFELFLAGQDGFELAHPAVRRLPDQVYWGRIDLTDPNALQAVLAFLENHVYTRGIVDPGQYGYFEVLPDHSTRLHDQGTYSTAPHSFPFSCLTDRGAELIEALEALSDSLEGRLNVVLWNPQERLR